MADLTGVFNATGIVKGQSNTITLNKTSLNALFSDAYFDVLTNWKKVIATYKSNKGQLNDLVFSAEDASPTGNFNPSSLAQDANWEIQSITIMDFDNGYLKLLRGDLTTADFDIVLSVVGFGQYSISTVATNYKFENYGGSSIFGRTVLGGSRFTYTVWFKHTKAAGAFIFSGSNGLSCSTNTDGTISIGANTGGNNLASITDSSDGNWHCIVVPCEQGSSLDVTIDRIFYDGVEYLLGNTITTSSIQRFGSDSLTNVSNIAHSDCFIGATVFNNTEALEYYNSGVVLDPSTHSRASDLVRSFSFGDHVLDNTVQFGSSYVVIVNTLDPTQATALRVQLGGTPLLVTDPALIVEDHPST